MSRNKASLKEYYEVFNRPAVIYQLKIKTSANKGSGVLSLCSQGKYQ